LAGAIHDSTGSFNNSFLIVVAIFIVGIVAFALTRPIPIDVDEPTTAEA
jgi:hypothetical protein